MQACVFECVVCAVCLCDSFIRNQQNKSKISFRARYVKWKVISKKNTYAHTTQHRNEESKDNEFECGRSRISVLRKILKWLTIACICRVKRVLFFYLIWNYSGSENTAACLFWRIACSFCVYIDALLSKSLGGVPFLLVFSLSRKNYIAVTAKNVRFLLCLFQLNHWIAHIDLLSVYFWSVLNTKHTCLCVSLTYIQDFRYGFCCLACNKVACMWCAVSGLVYLGNGISKNVRAFLCMRMSLSICVHTH